MMDVGSYGSHGYTWLVTVDLSYRWQLDAAHYLLDTGG